MQLIAHRGFSGLRVENTLAAFGNAINLGASGAELDVQLSADGQVVVHHNASLNRAYCRRLDGTWLDKEDVMPLASLSYQDMQAYDIGTPKPGSKYAAKFDHIEPLAGQKIPLLRDVIRLAKGASDDFFLVIEIKTPILVAGQRPWLPLIDQVLAIIEQEAFGDRFVLCSFDWGSMIHAKEQRPATKTWFTTQPLSWYGTGQPPATDIPPRNANLQKLRECYRNGGAPWFGGFDPRHFADGYPEAIARAGGNAWFMYYRDCTSQQVLASAGHGLDSAFWSLNLRDADVIRELARTGVTAACLDYPDIDFAAA